MIKLYSLLDLEMLHTSVVYDLSGKSSLSCGIEVNVDQKQYDDGHTNCCKTFPSCNNIYIIINALLFILNFIYKFYLLFITFLNYYLIF